MALIGDQPAPEGGGSTPGLTEAYVAGNVVVANGATGNLPWSPNQDVTTLLDLTVPDAPTVTKAGTYAVVAIVQPSTPMTVGGSLNCTLGLDITDFFYDQQIDSSPASVAVPNPFTSLCVIAHLDEGAGIQIQVLNIDGVKDLTLQNSLATVTWIGP